MGVKVKEWFGSNKQRIIFVISIIIFFFACAGFVFTPMTGDIKVFMASANQSNYISDNLIVGAFKAWELKSVFSRTLMYLIYKIVCLICPYGTLLFEILSKFLYSIITIVFVFIATKLLFWKDKTKVVLISAMISTSLFALHTGCQMQVEMTSTVLLLLAFSLYTNAIMTQRFWIAKQLCSGFLIGSTFFFKSALILLSVTVVSAVCIYLLNNNAKFSIIRLLTVISGSIISLVLTFGLILLINPSEIQDILDASIFQSTLLSVRIPIKELAISFISQHIKNIIFLPVVFVGIISLILNIVNHLRHRKLLITLFHVTMWLMPALFILLSNKYFIYHFATYIFPSFIEIYYCHKNQNRVFKALFRFSLVLSIVWYIIAFSILSPNFRAYYRCNITAYEKTEQELNRINFDKSETILYLDAGCGAYCLGNPSLIKYYYPLPLQRLPEDSNLQCHKESLEAALNFDGKYIAVDEDWFFFPDRNLVLKNKIEKEYKVVASYYMFSPPFSYYPSEANVGEFKLYEKK